MEEYIYNCSVVPLFELGSLFHDFYLLNVRLPADTDKNINQGLGHITDLWLTVLLLKYISPTSEVTFSHFIPAVLYPSLFYDRLLTRTGVLRKSGSA